MKKSEQLLRECIDYLINGESLLKRPFAAKELPVGDIGLRKKSYLCLPCATNWVEIVLVDCFSV